MGPVRADAGPAQPAWPRHNLRQIARSLAVIPIVVTSEIAQRPQPPCFMWQHQRRTLIKIDVDALWMQRYHPEICLRRIGILDQVVPDVPLPNNLAAMGGFG